MVCNQEGGARCSLCGAVGVNKSTCPLNPSSRNPNPAKHNTGAVAKQKQILNKPIKPKQVKNKEILKDKKILIKDEKEKRKPTILVLQSIYDPNRAFDEDGDEALKLLFKEIPGFVYKHTYISSVEDIINELEKNYPIAHLVIMAHGNAEGLKLGEHSLSYYDPNFFQLGEVINQNLHPKADIFLHSCAVGQGGRFTQNFAQALAVMTNRSVYGAEEPIRRGDLLVVNLIIKPEYINVEYVVDETQIKNSGRKPYAMLKFTPDQRGGYCTICVGL